MKYNKICFCKTLVILSVKLKKMLRPNNNVGMAHKKDNYQVCTLKLYEPLVFVQYYDIIGEEEVPNDKVDETLDCIRLKGKRQGRTKKEERKVNCLRYVQWTESVGE